MDDKRDRHLIKKIKTFGGIFLAGDSHVEALVDKL